MRRPLAAYRLERRYRRLNGKQENGIALIRTDPNPRSLIALLDYRTHHNYSTKKNQLGVASRWGMEWAGITYPRMALHVTGIGTIRYADREEAGRKRGCS
jgi:hypothetical protein